jgi:RND family efflux transporter MFP subunit
MKKIILFIIIIGIVFGAVKLYKTRLATKEAQDVPTKRYYSISTVQAENKNLRETRSFLAEAQAIRSVDISTKLTGLITKVYVSENSKVKKDELLIKIDDTELKSNFKALLSQKAAQMADVKYTKTILDRNKKLYDIGGLSREKYEASLVLYKNKVAIFRGTVEKIKQVKNQLTYLNIKAPFSGVVSKVILHEGDMALASKPILKLNSYKQKMIFTFANKSNDIKVSQDILVNNEKVGTINKIYDYTKNGLFVSEVKLHKDLDMPNNSLVNIEVVVDEKRGCSVPQSTLLHKNKELFVMIYKDDEFSPLSVNIELENEKEVIISPCPNYPVATASEAKLSLLPSLGKVKVGK